MRTTLDLEPRLMQRIRRKALDERKSLKEVINQALTQALDADGPATNRQRDYKLPLVSMGKPLCDLDKALALVDLMEEASLSTKLEMRK
jgi:hypothetical protein